MPVIKNHINIQELARKGLPISSGHKYVPKSWLIRKHISLTEIHRRFAKVKGSLAEEISQTRDQE